jgi:hypothetical protein
MISEGDAIFGQATGSLASASVNSNVPSAYQSGWPQTLQFTLRLSF